MSHPIARRAGMLALTAAMLMPSAGALSDVSSWAQEGVAAAQNAGLAPSSLSNSAASGSITRAEFCAVALNAYKAVSGKAVYVSGKKPFEDCSDPNVTAAYLLGIVKGRTNGNFDPDAKISREEMCTMLDNILAAADIEATEIAGDACIEDYPDVSMISDYAMQPVVTMVDHSVINGITDTSTDTTILAPSGTTTREQALIMANRFCTAFKPDKTPIAAVDGSANLPTTAGSSASAATTITGLPQTEAEKMTYVYGAGNGKYQSAAEAEAHMVEIVVPVWHLQSDGTKVASKAYLQVNASLASIYQAIFEEIFNGSEKFPIYDVGCYSWRTGEHSQAPQLISTRTRTWKLPSTRTVLCLRPAAPTGRRILIRTPSPRAAMFTMPSPSTASPGAATAGAPSATTCTSATSAAKHYIRNGQKKGRLIVSRPLSFVKFV